MSYQQNYSHTQLADRAAIQDVEYLWCRSVDRLDFDGMRSVFHPDAVDLHGAYNGGVDGLLAWIKERHQGVIFSQHFIGNVLIEFASDHLALVECYVRTTQRYSASGGEALRQVVGSNAAKPGVEMDMMTCSRYIDRLEKRNGHWKIILRNLVSDWKQVLPVEPNSLPPNAEWTYGIRGQDDLIYKSRRELGIN